MSQRTLILLGLRGSGKSTLAALVAPRLGLRAVDLDDLTPTQLGCTSVADAWRTHGEHAFRAAEARALRGVLDGPPVVLALGGGTPTAPGVPAMLRSERATKTLVVVYLHASPGTLRERLSQAENYHRPALLGGSSGGVLGEIEQVYAVRDPLYRSLADAVIDTPDLGLEGTATALVTLASADM